MRPTCSRCRLSIVTCYCEWVRPFEASVKFVVLVHPKENRNRVGTANIVRLCISNAKLLVGDGPALDQNRALIELLENPAHEPWVVYPGRTAKFLSRARSGDERSFFSAAKTPVIVLIDGTWHQARKMIRRSARLSALPQLAFLPSEPSRYRIRLQPEAHCVSTLEAIHQMIDLLASPSDAARPHDNLLEVFERMVARQVEFQRQKLQPFSRLNPPVRATGAEI